MSEAGGGEESEAARDAPGAGNGPGEVAAGGATVALRPHGLALCLSGGGYRATLFHLGAVRRLHELGLLDRVETISSVSGGSIFAGVLAKAAIEGGGSGGLGIGDFDRQVAEPVRKLVKHDLRTGPFLLNLPWNWALPGPRARCLQWLLKRNVTKSAIGDLPEQPRFVFCATDLTYGVSWESSKRQTGSWRAGYLIDGGAWPLARAIAASACFPPIFGPMPVGSALSAFRSGDVRRAIGGEQLHKRLSLSDGGVYDNMGLEPVWKDHRCILVSDGGAPFAFSASRNPLRRLLRYTSVISNQAQALRKRMFFTEIDRGTYEGTRWAIRDATAAAGDPGYSQALAERIAGIRTDLDRFTRAEREILENHGYLETNAKLKAKLPHLIPKGAEEATPPHPAWMDEAKASRALRTSHRRFSLRRMLRLA